MASFSDSSLPNLKISLSQDEDNDLIFDETMEDASNEREEINVKASSPVEEISIFEVTEEPEPKDDGVDNVGSPSPPPRRTRPKRTVSDDDIKNLHKEFGLAKSARSARLNAIHVRGVNEMSTSDIVDYFGGRGSADIEWINDYSCNVVWNDSSSAAIAMLAVSKPITRDATTENMSETKDQPLLPPNSPVIVIYSDQEEPMSEDEDDKDESKTKETDGGQSDLKAVLDVKTTDREDEAVTNEDSINIRSLGVPVPPGPWRLGNAHDKAKALLMRFATRTDRKLPGAEKRSDYYLKYGNPNYGGMKGIISTSRKRKLVPGRQRQPYRDLDSAQDHEEIQNFSGSSASGSDESPEIEFRRPKKLRMRMYADDEAERKVNKALQMNSNDSKSSSRRWSKESALTEVGDLRSRLTSNKRHIARPSSRDARHRLNSSSRRRNSSSDERHSRRRWREEERDYDDSRSSGDDVRSRHRLREEGERSSDDDDDEPSSRHRSGKRGKDRPNTTDDLRDKLDQLRKNKKFKQRSPLVIQVLSSANE